MMKNVKKNIIFNSIGSLINSSTSLLFLISVTRINGTNMAGIFTFAFSTACLFQVIGLYAGRTYQVSNLDKNINDSDFLYNKIFCCIVMMIVALLFVLIKNYELNKVIIIIFLALYKMIEAIADYFYALIQKKEKLYQVGISLGLKGIIGFITFLIIDILTKNVVYSILSLILVNILFIIFYDYKNSDIKKITKFNSKSFNMILTGGIFIFISTILNQYVFNASKYAIDNQLTNFDQTVYGIIVMPATIMILCSQFLVQPFLTKMTELIEKKQIKEFKKSVLKINLSVLGIGIIALLCAYLIGIPLLEFVYGISLYKYLYDLLIVIAGATIFGMTYVLLTSLIIIRKNIIQAIIFIITGIFSYFICNNLVSSSGIRGASIGYSLTMGILFVLYLISFLVYFKKVEK